MFTESRNNYFYRAAPAGCQQRATDLLAVSSERAPLNSTHSHAHESISTSPSLNSLKGSEPARELKFLLPTPLALEIHRWACNHLSPDPYADPARGNAYTITSLYFDTPEFHVFRRVGSFARSKYRIRRYDDRENIFFERKLKTNGRVSKRRTSATRLELERLSWMEFDRSWRGAWYHRRLLVRKLRPVCQIQYRRAAWIASTAEGPARLTLDETLRAVSVSQIAFAESTASVALLPRHAVLELKFRKNLPALFKGLLDEFALAPESVSKYRTAVAELGLMRCANALDALPKSAQTNSRHRSGPTE